MGKDILVIGNTRHSRAVCIQWRSPFPNIEEFDAVIIHMPSMDQSTFDYLAENESEKFDRLKKQLYTLFKTGRHIYCIFTKPLYPKPVPGQGKAIVKYKGRGYVDLSSYRWLFGSPEIREVSNGTSKPVEDKRFKTYFEGLKKWKYEIYASEGNGFSTSSLATNKSGKMIAAAIWRTSDEGCVYLLPELSSYSPEESIEILIDLMLGKKKGAEYSWREHIEIPGLDELRQKIQACKKRIEGLNKEIDRINKEYSEIESYRDIFSVDDELQVKAVKRVLYDIGIDCDLTEPNFMVDLRGKQVAVEVTSTIDKIRQASDSLNQIGLFIETERKGEKVILVANTYKRLPLQERRKRENFTEQAAKYLEASEVCFMTARFLYLLWRKVEEKRMSARDARILLLKTSTELTDGMM